MHLWPTAPIGLGVLRNKFAQKIALYLEKKIYQAAQKIIALSPNMQAGVLEKTPLKEVILIPNMADINLFYPQEKDKILAEKYQVNQKFVLSYFGAISYANHLEYMLEIAKVAQDKKLDKLTFWIGGKGAKMKEIKNLAQKYALKNVAFFEHQNTQNLKNLLQLTDAVYVSFLQNKVLESNSPNKFFDALAGGKLCTVNTAGWLKDLVEQNECGFYANPQNPTEFIQKIIPFLEDTNLLKIQQANARALAIKEFSMRY